MNIVVLIKYTPETSELPKVTEEEVRSGDIQVKMVPNPWDEYAAEEAIELCDRFEGEAVALTMGAANAADALKHALAMGVGSAALIDNTDLRGGDMWTTARALAAAIKAQGEVDLVLTGKQSVDDNSGAVFVGVAQQLGYPLLVNVSKIVDIVDGVITVERLVEGSQETVSAPLPAVVSVGKEINDPRYPSFMGIRKANRAQIPVTTLSELGMDTVAGQTSWTNIRKPEERDSEVAIIDGDSIQEKAAKLADALLAEKVI